MVVDVLCFPSVILDGSRVKGSNSGGIVEKVLADTDKLLVDFSNFSAEQNSQPPELFSSFTEKSRADGIDPIETIHNTIPSKRKRDQMAVNVDTSATNEINVSISSSIYVSPCTSKTDDVLETCGAYSKRHRYYY